MTGPLLLLALGAAVAWGSPGRAGDEAVFDVPIAETTAKGQAGVAAGLDTIVTPVGVGVGGYPMGFSFGVSERVSLGVSLQPSATTLLSDTHGGATLSGRYRVLDPEATQVAFATQVSVARFTDDARVEALAIGGMRTARYLPTVALGVRGSLRTGVGGLGGVGISVPVGSANTELLAEHRFVVDARGLSEWLVRAGARGSVGPVNLTGWGGTGAFEGIPWVGGGLALALVSIDLHLVDRDHDHVVDRADACVYESEDPDAWSDEDGCPDPDNDADGTADADDPTPNGEPLATTGTTAYTHPKPRFLQVIDQVQKPGPAAEAVRRKRKRDEGAPPAPADGGGP